MRRSVGLIFIMQSYGIVLPVESPFDEKIKAVLLKIIEQGLYNEIRDRWFGA